MILSHRSVLISSSIDTSVVDLPEPVGHVINTSHCLACINLSIARGNHSSSHVFAFFSILRREKPSFPRAQNPFTRKDTSFFLDTYPKSISWSVSRSLFVLG